jgi:hypothetical protein
MAAIGLGQRRAAGWIEPAMVTLGTDWSGIAALSPDGAPYSAAAAVRYLLGEPRP